MKQIVEKNFEKYKPIIVSIVVIIIFLAILGNFNNTIWHWVDAIISIGTIFGVWYNYNENKKQRKIKLQRIPIILKIKDTEERYRLKLRIPRKEISRGEIQGILSNYTTDPSKRYKIEYLSEIRYMEDIYKIQSNKLDELEIKVSEKEFEGYREIKITKEGKEIEDEYVGFDKNKLEKL